MSNLYLKSLEIENFRCFEKLIIEKLDRVNLIVGKNSVGKTALLEAVRIFASRGSPNTIADILGYRNETDYSSILLDNGGANDMSPPSEAEIDSAIKYLFNGRHYKIGDIFSIGAVYPKDSRLSIGVSLYAEERSELGRKLVGPIPKDDYESYESLVPRISINLDDSYRSSAPLFLEGRRAVLRRWEADDAITCQFIPVNGLDMRVIATLWERISLTNMEQDIVSTLSKVVPALSGVNLIGFSDRSPSREPFLIAKIKDQSPVPLKSLGDGLCRAFGVSLALANSRDGFLLIDEFETGLHHSVQTDIWRMIFDTASMLNVQILATTHSWDCVKAFQEAAAESEENDAMLIRLQQNKATGKIRAVSYDNEELAIVTEQHIEVR